jgi:hypothetical protein
LTLLGVQNYAVRVSNCLARVPRSCDEIGGSSTIQAKDFRYKKSRFPNPGLPHPRILLVFTLCLVPFGYFRTNTRVRVSSLSTRARGQGHLAGLDSVHGRFLRLENSLLQNCATRRSAEQISLVKTSSAKHREKLRKNSILNYESTALTAELSAHLPITSGRAIESGYSIESGRHCNDQ